jgi:hypothetical protein
VIRILIAVVVAVLYFKGIISGTLGVILLVLAGVFVLTSFLSFCPIYWTLGLSSRPKE